MSTKCFLTGIMMLGVALQAGAQTWSVGEISFSGVVDGYYSLNFNHPASRYNQLRNFDVEANQFGLNMVKLTMEHAAEPVGFRVDLGFGETFNLIHAGEAEPSAVRNLEQAYVSLKPPGARGFQFDFGEFVTSAGAEVIETYGNWNYSRSLLFTLAIPYYHMGARATVPMGKYFTGGVQLVNGWNDVQDNNSGKTVGLTGALTAGPVSWYGNYYGGPEKPDTNKGWRHLYDTTLLVSKPKASAYLNFDYGVDEEAPGGSDKVWYGVAGAARFELSDHVAVAPRLEWFRDQNGFSTGVAQTLKEFTITGEYKWADGLLSRLEYRRDWSDRPFFDRGAGGIGSYTHQDTLLLGFVAFFGPKQ